MFYYTHLFISSVGGGKSMSRETTARTPGPRELEEELTPPVRLEMLLDMPHASKEVQLKHAWNSEDRSLNIFVKVSFYLLKKIISFNLIYLTKYILTL
jgi:hypothetical protein